MVNSLTATGKAQSIDCGPLNSIKGLSNIKYF